MKITYVKIKKLVSNGLLILLSVYGLPLMAQQAYTSSATTTTIKGTSTLHDWDMKSSVGNTQASFKIENGEIKDITSLTFTVNAETLKSNRSGLDKNAYKALKTSKHKNITYSMKSGTVTKNGASYIIKTNGTLTVAGTTKPLALTTTATLNTDQSISVKGSTKFEMTTYGVTPPTVVMGTIKTGNAITIEYTSKLTN